jgi:multidrug efflux system membrane fusion protein
VKVTQIDNGEALIAEGLKPGESVVLDGQYKLQPGAKVRLGSAAASASGEANPSGHEGPRKAGGQKNGQGGPGGSGRSRDKSPDATPNPEKAS